MASSTRRNFTVWGLHIPSVVVASLVLFIFLTALAVLPFRTWMSQRSEADQLEAELEKVEEDNIELQRQKELLGTDAEVERRAREDYGYVYPGDEQYVVQPSHPSETTVAAQSAADE